MKVATIKVGKNHTRKTIVRELIDLSYEKTTTINKSGDFSTLGGTILVFPINSINPIRIELFGDEVERIISYDLETGKKKEGLKEVSIQANYLTLAKKEKILPGKYIVHEDHGIGIFAGLLTKRVKDEDTVYISISYLNEDKLFVPINLIEKISSYIGVGKKRPRLNKLGSSTWKNTYKKTYENIIKLARELLSIYAHRKISKRTPWIIDQDWNKEAIKTFGYKETLDQKKTISEVFNDLKSSNPMDRLICGDVGFGKTEVAIRASVQAVANGYQVAILVPTTILAEQHYATLKKRLENLPINVSHISRLVKAEEQKEIIKGLEEGLVDIIVGTHKLFSQKLTYKNLGLLIIDEEQKFGVKNKEKLKKLKKNLNVLSLTATPIPRTLFMALSGIRNLSQINIPPKGRKMIDTQVGKYNEEVIKKYIAREISRKGQVYYLHNDVSTIVSTKNKLLRMFPKLTIEVAHGQMGEIALSKTMRLFTEGKIDILVCSTIIENGLDLPNVNTLIVEDSDRFGLSSLYQIRGRIGRSMKESYALFTYKNKAITENAHRRLKALIENRELGSGYGIALSDLEIRGGGNILGREQHGNMEAIGLVLYTKLLNQAVAELKSKRVSSRTIFC